MSTPPTDCLADTMVRNWTFVPSQPNLLARLSLIRARFRRRPPPAFEVLRSAQPAPAWSLYFVFLANGAELADFHRYTIERLSHAGRVLIVAAAVSPEAARRAVGGLGDALIWKALPGFDMSGYAIGLTHLAAVSPGAQVHVQNDSVFGPLAPLDLLTPPPWRLTGFSASSAVENHIQTYALHLSSLDPDLLAAIGPVLSTRWCYDDYRAVVGLQETRLARTAAHRMTVGAHLYLAEARHGDPSLSTRVRRGAAQDLATNRDPSLRYALNAFAAGIPFVKRSLFGRYAAVSDQERLTALLTAAGHPVSQSG